MKADNEFLTVDSEPCLVGILIPENAIIYNLSLLYSV
jgi:hypothetical protein